MTKAITVAALAVGLAGCASSDLGGDASELRPVPGGYSFKTIADAIYPDGSPGAERQRIAIMEEKLRVNGFCPSGYQVVRRDAIVRNVGALGTIKDIIYTVKCRGAA